MPPLPDEIDRSRPPLVADAATAVRPPSRASPKALCTAILHASLLCAALHRGRRPCALPRTLPPPVVVPSGASLLPRAITSSGGVLRRSRRPPSRPPPLRTPPPPPSTALRAPSSTLAVPPSSLLRAVALGARHAIFSGRAARRPASLLPIAAAQKNRLLASPT